MLENTRVQYCGGKVPYTSDNKYLRNEKIMWDCNVISGATAELHLSALHTNKIIQFLQHYLPSTILTVSPLVYSYPCYRPTEWRNSHNHYLYTSFV